MAAAVTTGAVVVILDYVPHIFRPVPVSVGEAAPTFVLESSTGGRVDLADYIGRKAVLLVFHAGYQ